MRVNPIAYGPRVNSVDTVSSFTNVAKKGNVSNKSFSLPSFKMMGAMMPFSISFKGNFEEDAINDVNRKYIEEIQKLTKELDALKNAEESSSVKKAREDNAFYDDFVRFRSLYERWAEDSYNQKVKDWEDKHSGWYVFWHGSDKDKLWSEAYASFNAKRDRYYSINYSHNVEIINLANKSADERMKRIAIVEELISNYKTLIDYANLQNTVNNMLNGHGGINDRIAGYKPVKDKIRRFIESIKNSKENEYGQVSPCVLLYGATGTGKTTFLRAIESMKMDNVAIVRFNEDSSKPFMERFRNAMTEAKQRYLNDKQRTILLMDDAEKYFAMSIADAEANYKNELDRDDIERLKTINEAGSNRNVKEFKAILDELSKVPEGDFEDENSFKSAMSIFITTNHPNLIDRQLIKRPEKMDAYHVGPANGVDLNDVVKFYFKDKIAVIEHLKLFKDRDDREVAINGFDGLSIDAKNSIKKMFREGTIDSLNIDVDNVDFSSLTEDMQPNEQEGAYSNVMIKTIAQNAFDNYLQNPENSFAQCFYEEVENTSRDIEPQRYKRYLETAGYVNLFKERKILNLENKYTLIKTINERNKNLLTVDKKKQLESTLKDFEVRKGILEEKNNLGNISENECVELKELLDLLSYVNDPQKVKEYLKAHKQNTTGN